MSGQRTLSDQSVEVLVVGSLDAKVATAYVVDGLVIDHETAVGVLESGVGCENGVVWLDNRRSDLRSGVDTELELAFLAIVDGETLHQQSTEAGTCTPTEGVEDKEALETGTVVCNTADLVEDLVDELLADGVVATGVVVGSILLASDHVLGVEELSVGASADFIDDVGLEITVDGSRNIFALACFPMSTSNAALTRGPLTSLGEEGAEALIGIGGLAFGGEETIGLSRHQYVVAQGTGGAVYLDAVLEAIQLQLGQYELFKKSVSGQYGPPSKSWQFDSQPGRL